MCVCVCVCVYTTEPGNTTTINSTFKCYIVNTDEVSASSRNKTFVDETEKLIQNHIKNLFDFITS